MTATLRNLVVPVFLFLCIVLGGSGQSVWGVLALQLLALLIIAGAALGSDRDAQTAGRPLLLLFVAAFALIGIQLIPLPPTLWTQLPGRDLVEAGFRYLGVELPWLPLSLTPYPTLSAVLFLLPPLAIVLAIVRAHAYSDVWVAAALLGGTFAGVMLGYVQVSTGRFGNADWYLYEQTNVGSAVGFFANRNHMGTLLLMALPFAVALFFASVRSERKKRSALAVLGGAGLIAILLGIAINGSLAAVALAVPVVTASSLIVPALKHFRAVAASATAVAVIGALVFLANSPVQPKLTGETTSSFEGRWQIWTNTWQAVERTFPAGTGFGSFEPVYAAMEPDQQVRSVYVNLAHNDYLQLFLEGGLPALVLVLLFIGWWSHRVWRIFRSAAASPFTAAAAIASGAVLAHSFVDYPLRTTAIAAIFAMCVALMARSHAARAADGQEERWTRPARHVAIS